MSYFVGPKPSSTLLMINGTGGFGSAKRTMANAHAPRATSVQILCILVFLQKLHLSFEA